MLAPSVTTMPLPYPRYLDHIRTESARFHAVLATADPDARVPSCPEWTSADLLSHLTGVQWFWEQVLHQRPAPPADDLESSRPARPEAYADLLDAFEAQSASFVTVLSSLPPEEPAWHWLSGGQTAGTSYRRQAHEALIHRLDAEQVAGSVTPLDPALAADGVLEALDWMYGGELPEGMVFEPTGELVAVELSDAGETILVEPGRIPDGKHAGPHLMVRPSGSTGASVRGTAGDVDAWLWHRAPDSVVTASGDPDLLAAFRAAVSPALD